MATIVVLAIMAAVLQLAGALTKPDCPVMEGEMIAFVYRSNRARDFARSYFFYGMPGRGDGSRGGSCYILAAAYVSM